MRILRLRIKDFRGVADRALDFNPAGVTVVEGPNESGKSSLAEAIDLLFEQPDSSKKQAVLQTKPVDRDTGPEIEAEITAGPYHFVYRKRFIRKPETVLEVTSPRKEHATGREAHDRVRAILDETVDLDLWKALRVNQGDLLGRVPVGKIASLGNALDRAAGKETAGEREQTLFEAVQGEYRRYYTESGLENKELRASAERTAALEAVVATTDAELKTMQQDVDRSEAIAIAIPELKRVSAEAAELAIRREAERLEVEKREAEVQRLELAEQNARMAETAAVQQVADREALVRKVEEVQQQRRRLEAEAATEQPALVDAKARCDSATGTLATAEAAVGEAEAALALRERDFEYQRARLDLEQLRERRARIEEARQRAASAREFLDRTRITDEIVRRIRECHLALEKAQALLDAGGPRLRVTALASLTAEIDGVAETLQLHQVLERAVPGQTVLRIPGTAEIVVSAGTSVENLLAARDRAGRAQQEALGRAGVSDMEAAERENERRRESERVTTASEVTVRENLRDLTLDAMVEKILALAWVEDYPAKRPASPPLMPEFDSAEAAHREARETLGRARAARDRAREDAQTADRRVNDLTNRLQAKAVELRISTQSEKQATAELAAAREQKPDENLASALHLARERAWTSAATLQQAQSALRSANPEMVRQFASNANKAELASAQRLRAAEDELRDVAARLELQGERGLFDARENAESRLEHARRDHRSLTARAAAARLLFVTFRNARDASRRAYQAPLRDKIVSLGRFVFDETFGVELDEDLAIDTRTLQGVTLPFDSISVGAREQLSLIARLACALLVNQEDGVPLILDDTLGHCDPARLEDMGALLSFASRWCQIIVLTCTYARFRHVGDARVVRLQ